MDTAMEIRRRLVAKGQIAVRYAKECINKGIDTDMDTAMGYESALF